MPYSPQRLIAISAQCAEVETAKLRSVRCEGWDRLRTAVEQALSLGCQDVAAIRHLTGCRAADQAIR